MSKASELAARLKLAAAHPFNLPEHEWIGEAADLILEQEKALREAEKALGDYAILGAGKCYIGKKEAEQAAAALAAIRKVRGKE